MSARPTHARGSSAAADMLVLLPLIVFLALAALFFFRLGAGDPSRIPSALIGRPAPDDRSAADRRSDQGRQAGARSGHGAISTAQ